MSFGNYVVYNGSKEHETYPTITVENKRNNPTIFKIKNNKDESFFEISLKANEVVTIDSMLCMISRKLLLSFHPTLKQKKL